MARSRASVPVPPSSVISLAWRRCDRHQQCVGRRFLLMTSAKSSNRSGVTGCVSQVSVVAVALFALAFAVALVAVMAPPWQPFRTPADRYAASVDRRQGRVG